MRNPIKYDLEKLAATIKQIPKSVATEAVNFSKERFREQGWKDQVLEPWVKRRQDRKKDHGRAVLVKSGRLRRSIKTHISGMDVTISTDVPYAAAHNEGFKGEVSDSVGEYTRKAHTRKGYTRKDGKAIKATQVAAHKVGQFTRKRNVDLPKRQFIGPSAALDRAVVKIIDHAIAQALK